MHAHDRSTVDQGRQVGIEDVGRMNSHENYLSDSALAVNGPRPMRLADSIWSLP